MSDDIDRRRYAAYDTRLDRIEQKIDGLTTAMISIARVEERIAMVDSDIQTHQQRLNTHGAKLDEMDHSAVKYASIEKNIESATVSIKEQSDKLYDLSSKVDSMNRTTNAINRIFWTACAAATAYGVNQFLL